MIGETLARFALGMLLGAAAGWGHLYLLKHALDQGMRDGDERALKRISQGMPLRLLLWAPVAIVVGRLELPACLGMLMGMLMSRWLIWHHAVQTR